MRAIDEDQCYQDQGFMGQPAARDLRPQFQVVAQARTATVRAPAQDGVALEHDPEKWLPVFRKDHAQTKR
jgi:hypothetical protein